MWVRKTKGKLQAETQAAGRTRFSPLLPFFLGALVGLLALLWEQSWSFFLFITGVSFVLIYGWRLIFGDRHLLDFASTLITLPVVTISQEQCICTACYEPQAPRNEGCFACGAKLEEISEWEWVDRAKARRRVET